MNPLSKIGLAALFSLILTACDKPKTTEPAPAPTQTEEKATSAPQETKTETVKTEAQPTDTGAEDYKMLTEWQNTQEKALSDAMEKAVAQLNDKQKADPALVQESINKTLLSQLDSIKVSAESLNIQNAEVKALKDKTIEVLTLGAQMIVEGSAMEKNPTPEAHKAFGELQTKLNQLANEGQQLENALKAKYAPAEEINADKIPAEETAPQQEKSTAQ